MEAGAPDPEETARRVERLAVALKAAVAEAAQGVRPCTVLYSGGLDSSIVARLVPQPPGVLLRSVGLSGASDLEAARSGARALGLRIEERELTTGDVDRVVRTAELEAGDRPEPLRSVRVTLALALESLRGEHVLVGQGADELFYGYAHFRGLSPREARDRSARDLQLLVEQEWPWTLRVAARHSVDLAAPFLDRRVVAAAQSLPPPDAALGEPPKHLLRLAARRLGVPEELVVRPKRAMQYGTGVARQLARVATRD